MRRLQLGFGPRLVDPLAIDFGRFHGAQHGSRTGLAENIEELGVQRARKRPREVQFVEGIFINRDDDDRGLWRLRPPQLKERVEAPLLRRLQQSEIRDQHHEQPDREPPAPHSRSLLEPIHRPSGRHPPAGQS